MESETEKKQKTGSPAPEEAGASRRSFIAGMVLGWGSMMAFLGAVGAWWGKLMMPRAIYEQSPRFKVGSPSDYPLGTPTQVPGRPVWILHYEEGFAAMIGICTHLGCRPNWIESQGLFRCPCHGSVYDKYGTNIAGPAPRPMERAGLELSPDMRLVVDMSKVFKPANMLEAHDPEKFFKPEKTA
jgi:cytochrome b6-f complex iron-sulfur subunit